MDQSHTLFVAQSTGTNAEGIAELRQIVHPFGYEVHTVGLRDGRNMKAACTLIPPYFVLMNPSWVDPSAFSDFTIISVDEAEPPAANTLTLGTTTLVSASFPRTERRLRDAGIRTRSVNITEFEKIGGRLTRLILVKESRIAKLTAINHGLKTVQIPEVPVSSRHAAQAIVYGSLVYVSAQLPFTLAATEPPCMAIEEQTEQVLRNVALVLQSAGSSLADVLHTTVHLADPKHLKRIEATYARMFAGHRPVRSVISNRALPAGVLVEIEVVAAVSKGRHA